jgi:hypothetical protein
MRRILIALSVGVVIGMSCTFTFSEEYLYSCATDDDCGGDGFKCNAGVCCRSTGDEVCGDGIDNDCDGHIDGDEMIEVCNGRDDDCNGVTDQGFDFQTSPLDCGTCGHACDFATEQCSAGACVRRAETNCANGIDDDQNGKTDCAEPGCNMLSCGTGCACLALARSEALCLDGVDNDGDGTSDCSDPDCDAKSCGDGCSCAGGARRETDCSDQVDNDLDGGTDCADSACDSQVCVAGTSQRCSAGACRCNGGSVVPELGALCGDGIDNDCDLGTDCAEAACDQESCSADGGPDCLCAGAKSTERSCVNGTDDDRDQLVDCADVIDCPELTPCRAGGRAGVCNAIAQCAVELCFDNADNDGDQLRDCGDSDCNGESCQADGGTGCQCVGMVKTEMSCLDRTDNDDDGQADCADFVDCPQGTACTRNNGSPGTCQSNRNCN